jgi:hypothetical protein
VYEIIRILLLEIFTGYRTLEGANLGFSLRFGPRESADEFQI